MLANDNYGAAAWKDTRWNDGFLANCPSAKPFTSREHDLSLLLRDLTGNKQVSNPASPPPDTLELKHMIAAAHTDSVIAGNPIRDEVITKLNNLVEMI